MNAKKELKLAIYESVLDDTDKNDLIAIVESTDDIEILSDIIDVLEYTDDIFMEKKTREQYRIERFKKKYGFTPFPKDKNKGMITINGDDILVDLKSDTINTITNHKNFGQINLNDKFFKLKNDKRRDAILQHEMGHTKMHNLNPDAFNADERFISNKVYGNAKRTYVNSNSTNNPMWKKVKDDISKKEFDSGMHNLKKFKEIAKRNKKSDFSQERERNIEFLKTKVPRGHDSSLTDEFESDLYASHRSGGKHLKRGLREAAKKMTTEKEIKKKYGNDGSVSKTKLDEIGKDVRRHIHEQMTARNKIINDKNAQSSRIYK